MRIFRSLAVVLMSAGLALPALADTTIRCESGGNRHKVCPLSDYGYVYLSRQLSSSSCVQGRTWDYDRRAIWVDDGCRAEFRVETREHSSNDSGRHSGEKAAAAIIALGLLAALAGKDKSDKNDRYNDSNYQHGGHASYMSSWMVGQFYGANRKFGNAEVSLNIGQNGRVMATINGLNVSGYINDERLYVGDAEFYLTRTRDGLMTEQLGHPDNVVYYTRY